MKKLSVYGDVALLAAIAAWAEVYVPEPFVGLAAVDDLPNYFVLTHERTAVGVGGSVADVYAHAAEAGHVVDERHAAAGECLVGLLGPELGGVAVQQHLVASCGYGRLSLLLNPTEVQAVVVFEGVTEVAAVDIQAPDGVVLLAGDAM